MGKRMYITPFGVVLVSLYVCISASAGVYNEWLYKGFCKDDSIHVCNIRLYAIGILFNLAVHASKGGAGIGAITSGPVFGGWNKYTVALYCVYTFMGLLISQI